MPARLTTGQLSVNIYLCLRYSTIISLLPCTLCAIFLKFWHLQARLILDLKNFLEVLKSLRELAERKLLLSLELTVAIPDYWSNFDPLHLLKIVIHQDNLVGLAIAVCAIGNRGFDTGDHGSRI